MHEKGHENSKEESLLMSTTMGGMEKDGKVAMISRIQAHATVYEKCSRNVKETAYNENTKNMTVGEVEKK